MIRPFTCLTLLLAGGSGLFLYSEKHQAQLLDRDTAKLVRSAQENRSRASMLHAEYDLLGDPERLRELSGQVLTLQSTAPTQFTTFPELDRRLPPPGPLPAPPERPVVAPAPVAATAFEKPAEKLVERPWEKPVDKVTERPTERPIAALPPTPRPVAKPAPAPVVASNAAPSVAISPSAALMPPTILSRPAPPPTPAPVRVVAPAPAPATAPVIRRAPVELQPVPASETLARVVRAGAENQAVPVVASALGMARALIAAPANPSTPQAQPVSMSQVRR